MSPHRPGARSRKHHGDDLADDIAVEVRHVQPYEAVKSYRCPGCDHDIAPGQGHKVVVPTNDPDLRRHWHTGCWTQRERRRNRTNDTRR